ncbi:MAG: GNAT family N-acetyltransferase [Firmicutes bacterium]|nr:GNAT family N-acetyltransferase [Bacillota bacterium]
MSEQFINLTMDNLAQEHLCCALADKKHRLGVEAKRSWLAERIPEGHVFRKLDAQGKVFIEFAPLEKAWVPVVGEKYLFIYCFWVAGSFKNKGYGRELLTYCIEEAKRQGKSGVCVLSSKKKKPYLSDKKYLEKYGFTVVDRIDDYELLALSFDGRKPAFAESARKQGIDREELIIYYGKQCPFIVNCLEQAQLFCTENKIPLTLVEVDTLEKAKAVPGVFNNWAVFYKGKFQTVQLLNEGQLKKLVCR